MYLTNSLITEPEGSAPLILKPIIGNDPEPVPSTSDAHNIRSFLIFSSHVFRGVSLGPWKKRNEYSSKQRETKKKQNTQQNMFSC